MPRATFIHTRHRSTISPKDSQEKEKFQDQAAGLKRMGNGVSVAFFIRAQLPPDLAGTNVYFYHPCLNPCTLQRRQFPSSNLLQNMRMPGN
jgi:hypothetical protein